MRNVQIVEQSVGVLMMLTKVAVTSEDQPLVYPQFRRFRPQQRSGLVLFERLLRAEDFARAEQKQAYELNSFVKQQCALQLVVMGSMYCGSTGLLWL